MLSRLFRIATQWIERLEEIPIGAAGWAGGFLAIVAVRHLLELRSSGYPLYPPSAFYVHYVLAYLAPSLALCLILALASGVRIERVLRLMLLAWGLTLLPPLVDTLIARAHQAQIGYMELGETPWLTVLLHFFDPRMALEGTTPGIRIEAAIACLLGFTYVALRASSQRWVRGLAAAAGVYVTAIAFFTLPTLFLRALRLMIPGLTLNSLLKEVGRIARPSMVEARADPPLLIYLVPLTLALGAGALAMAKSPLLRRAASACLSSEGWGWGIMTALGSLAGWRLLEGIPRPVPSAPFDALALAAAPFALVLAGGALDLLAPGGESAERPLAGASAMGAMLLAAAGILAASASIECAAFGAIALGAGLLARGLPRVLPWAAGAPQIAAGIAALAAFLAGYALLAGDEAPILLPAPLYVLAFLLGFAADLPRAFEQVRWRPQLSPMAAATVPLLALAVPAIALGARPTAGWIALAVVASAVCLAATAFLPYRIAGAAALLGAALILASLLSDSAQAAAWRARALASPVYFLRLSERDEAAGDLEGAAGAADQAARLQPDLPRAHQRLGLLRFKRGDTEGAIAELSTAISLDPADADLRGNLATALLKVGRNEEALAAVDAAVSLPGATPKVFFIRAQCLDALQRGPEALAAWGAYVARAEGIPDEAPYFELARRRLAGHAPP